MTSATPDQLISAARAALWNVWDPELGIDVVSLGLIYDVRVDGEGLTVDMTLTTPGCPVSEQLPGEAAAAIRSALPEYPTRVNVVWDPPWSPERMSSEALVSLGLHRTDLGSR